jgi:hypothetical protein
MRIFMGADIRQNGRIISKEVVVCPAKNFDKRFFDDQTGNAARAGFFGSAPSPRARRGRGSMLDQDQLRMACFRYPIWVGETDFGKKTISALPLDNVVKKVLNEILCCFGKANWYGNRSISRMKLGGQL